MGGGERHLLPLVREDLDRDSCWAALLATGEETCRARTGTPASSLIFLVAGLTGADCGTVFLLSTLADRLAAGEKVMMGGWSGTTSHCFWRPKRSRERKDRRHISGSLTVDLLSAPPDPSHLAW